MRVKTLREVVSMADIVDFRGSAVSRAKLEPQDYVIWNQPVPDFGFT